jgi:DNA-binding winged helix-turn-helix (wHTH) protein/Tol biopolymer transport system component
LNTKNHHENFSFIGFNVIPQANLLIKKSREKRIEPKVMSLLILLASKNGEVVTRDEIFSELWPNMVVGDEVISQLVYSLRNALADDAKNPKYIETIPKKGYRFIAKVNLTEDNPSTNAEVDTTHVAVTLADKKQITSKSIWLLGGCFFLLVSFVLIWLVTKTYLQEETSHLIIKNILPVTQSKGVESSFSFYKDHNKMAYVASQDEQVDIYQKTLGNNHSEQLTNDEWVESSPLWTDEKTLLYIRKISGQYQIIRQSLAGEIEVIYESSNAIYSLVLQTNVSSTISFIEYDDYQHNRLYELKSLNLINNEVTYLYNSVLNLPSEIRHQVYSQDGRQLYFLDLSDNIKNIVSLDLQSNQYTTITKAFSWVGHIAILDAENLLISGELSATKGIWKLNIIDKSIKSILPSSSGQQITRALFKQGQIYYSTYKVSINQVIADVKLQTLDQLPKLNSDANEHNGLYSKNNNTIYFTSNRTGFYEIWSYNISTKQVQQISHLKASFIHKPVLSHAQDHFAVVYEKEELVLSIISLATGKPISESKITEMKYPLAWNNDDTSIYVSEHKKYVNIYSYDSETLQPTLIQQNAGLFAQENENGESLTLIDYKLGGLIRKNTVNEKTTLINSSILNLEYLYPGELMVTNTSIFSMNKEGPTRKIIQYPLDDSQQNQAMKVVMSLPDWAQVTDFNTDGSKVLFSKRGQPEGDIMTIQLAQ